MELSKFRGELLPRYHEIFCAAHPGSRVSFERFLRNTVLDRNFSEDCFFTVSENGEAVGFVYAPRRLYAISKENAPDLTGYITLLSVDPRADVLPAADLLLSAAENYHLKEGRGKLTTGYYPVYINQGIATDEAVYIEAFRNRGYDGKETAQRRLLLSERTRQDVEALREKRAQEGFYLGPLRPEYIDSYLREDAPFSNPSWAWEFRARLEAGLDFESVHIAAREGKVIGACVFGDPNSDAERFGPYGVQQEYRGLGLGKILLEDTLREMEKRGLFSAWMQWTPKEGAADALYRKFGFLVTQSFITFEKEAQHVSPRD